MPQLDLYSFFSIASSMYIFVIIIGYMFYATVVFPTSYFKFYFINFLAISKQFLKRHSNVIPSINPRKKFVILWYRVCIFLGSPLVINAIAVFTFAVIGFINSNESALLHCMDAPAPAPINYDAPPIDPTVYRPGYSWREDFHRRNGRYPTYAELQAYCRSIDSYMIKNYEAHGSIFAKGFTLELHSLYYANRFPEMSPDEATAYVTRTSYPHHHYILVKAATIVDVTPSYNYLLLTKTNPPLFVRGVTFQFQPPRSCRIL